MDDVVVGALGKGAIDIAERQESFLGHSAREGNGMSLGNAHIEGALGHLLHHDIHRTASRHGWGNTYNLRILTG